MDYNADSAYVSMEPSKSPFSVASPIVSQKRKKKKNPADSEVQNAVSHMERIKFQPSPVEVDSYPSNADVTDTKSKAFSPSGSARYALDKNMVSTCIAIHYAWNLVLLTNILCFRAKTHVM